MSQLLRVLEQIQEVNIVIIPIELHVYAAALP